MSVDSSKGDTMPNKDLSTVIHGSTGQGRYYNHTAYVERQQYHNAPQMIEIEPDTGYVVQPAFTSHDGAEEHTSGRDRALGLLIRLIPLSLFVLILTIGVGLLLLVLTDVDVIWAVIFGAIIFAGMCLLAFNRESLRDYYFSRSGLERHRIDVAASLKEQELDYQFRLKRMLLKQHLQMLETMERDNSTN